jgi:ribonuclease D
MNTRIVDTARQLEECCDSLAGADWITVDTEFMRERTYYPQLCLVQLGIPGQAWCVDALADLSLQPALELVCLQRSRRVLHAARQDLEIFFHLVGSFTSELFDTQIAAALLGFDAQIGYAGLVKELSGTELEKGYQRANWATRPLPSAQLEYALDDVRYLAELYPEILDRLGELGRLDWATEDSARLLRRELYVTDPAIAYLRIGQTRTLNATEQHIVRRLARWREQLAQELDRPRNWIGSDSTLIYMAQTKPDTRVRLQRVKGISPELIEKHSEQLLQAIAVDSDAGRDSLLEQPNPLTDQEQKRYRRLKERLDQCAKSLGINTPVLGTRKDVELLLRGGQGSVLTEGWRKEIIGEELMDMR